MGRSMLRRLTYTTILCLALRTAGGNEFVLTQLDVPVDESFDEFRGTLTTLPEGFSVSEKTNVPMEEGDVDFRGVSPGGVITGGCYAWAVAPDDYALGFQPTDNKFTPGYFMVVASNATGSSLSSLALSYDIVFLNDQDRSSTLDLDVSLDGSVFSRIQEAAFCTPQARETPASWKQCARSVRVRFGGPLSPGAKVWIRWKGNDGGGSGSRDEYRINNFRIVPYGSDGTVMTVK